MVYLNGSWQILWGVTQSSVDGCTTWPLSTGYSWSFRAYYRVGNTYFIGTAATYYVNAGFNYRFGPAYVSQSGF